MFTKTRLPHYYFGDDDVNQDDKLNRNDSICSVVEDFCASEPNLSRIPSPASSLASTKKLEWDSGADIGYSNAYNSFKKSRRSKSFPSLNMDLSISQINKSEGQGDEISIENKVADDVNKEISSTNSQCTKTSKKSNFKHSTPYGSKMVSRNSVSSFKSNLTTCQTESANKNKDECLQTTMVKNCSRSVQTDTVSSNDNQKINKSIQTDTIKSLSSSSGNSLSKSSSFQYVSCVNTERLSSVDTRLPQKVESIESSSKSSRSSKTNSKSVSSNSSKPSTAESISLNTSPLAKIISTQQSNHLITDIDKSLSLLQNFIQSKNYTPDTKKFYARKIVNKIIASKYSDDSSSTSLSTNKSSEQPIEPNILLKIANSKDVNTSGSEETGTPLTSSRGVQCDPVQKNVGTETSDKNKELIKKLEEMVTKNEKMAEKSKNKNKSEIYLRDKKWKEAETLSEKLFEARRKSTPSSEGSTNTAAKDESKKGDYIVQHSKKERKRQLSWINNEISYLHRLKELLQKHDMSSNSSPDLEIKNVSHSRNHSEKCNSITRNKSTFSDIENKFYQEFGSDSSNASEKKETLKKLSKLLTNDQIKYLIDNDVKEHQSCEDCKSKQICDNKNEYKSYDSPLEASKSDFKTYVCPSQASKSDVKTHVCPSQASKKTYVCPSQASKKTYVCPSQDSKKTYVCPSQASKKTYVCPSQASKSDVKTYVCPSQDSKKTYVCPSQASKPDVKTNVCPSQASKKTYVCPSEASKKTYVCPSEASKSEDTKSDCLSHEEKNNSFHSHSYKFYDNVINSNVKQPVCVTEQQNKKFSLTTDAGTQCTFKKKKHQPRPVSTDDSTLSTDYSYDRNDVQVFYKNTSKFNQYDSQSTAYGDSVPYFQFKQPHSPNKGKENYYCRRKPAKQYAKPIAYFLQLEEVNMSDFYQDTLRNSVLECVTVKIPKLGKSGPQSKQNPPVFRIPSIPENPEPVSTEKQNKNECNENYTRKPIDTVTYYTGPTTAHKTTDTNVESDSPVYTKPKSSTKSASIEEQNINECNENNTRKTIDTMTYTVPTSNTNEESDPPVFRKPKSPTKSKPKSSTKPKPKSPTKSKPKSPTKSKPVPTKEQNKNEHNKNNARKPIETVTYRIPKSSTSVQKTTTTYAESDQKTLQDYLSTNRPDYVRVADWRRSIILDQIDQNRRSRSIFTCAEMIKRTNDKFNQLPEVQYKKHMLKVKNQRRHHRCMASVFSKKLQRKTLKGELSIATCITVMSADSS